MIQDSAGVLEAVERAVGRPPRRFSKLVRTYGDPPRARFAQPPDLTSKLYDHYRQTLKRGRVCWAAIVHANNTLFEPGLATSGGQVVYAEDEATLDDVVAIAQRMAATKNTTPSDPAVRKLADMLTDEMERALDWPLPEALSGGKCAYPTITMLHRPTVPDGFLGLGFFPVLADPSTKYAAIVPSEYWPGALIEQWRAGTGEVLYRLATEQVVTLTPLAVEALGGIAAEHGFSPFHVRLYLVPDGRGGVLPQLEVTEDAPDTEGCAVHEQDGVTVAVPMSDVPLLRDKVFDYEADAAGGGYEFKNFLVRRGM